MSSFYNVIQKFPCTQSSFVEKELKEEVCSVEPKCVFNVGEGQHEPKGIMRSDDEEDRRYNFGK